MALREDASQTGLDVLDPAGLGLEKKAFQVDELPNPAELPRSGKFALGSRVVAQPPASPRQGEMRLAALGPGCDAMSQMVACTDEVVLGKGSLRPTPMQAGGYLRIDEVIGNAGQDQ